MNTESAKKVVKLCREASGYASMQRKGLLTQDEAAELIAACNLQIAELRAQRDLPLKGAEAAPAAKGRTS